MWARLSMICRGLRPREALWRASHRPASCAIGVCPPVIRHRRVEVGSARLEWTPERVGQSPGHADAREEGPDSSGQGAG